MSKEFAMKMQQVLAFRGGDGAASLPVTPEENANNPAFLDGWAARSEARHLGIDTNAHWINQWSLHGQPKADDPYWKEWKRGWWAESFTNINGI